MKKRLLSLVLCLVMVFSLFPSFAAASQVENALSDGNYIYSPVGTAATTWTTETDFSATQYYWSDGTNYYPVRTEQVTGENYHFFKPETVTLNAGSSLAKDYYFKEANDAFQPVYTESSHLYTIVTKDNYKPGAFQSTIKNVGYDMEDNFDSFMRTGYVGDQYSWGWPSDNNRFFVENGNVHLIYYNTHADVRADIWNSNFRTTLFYFNDLNSEYNEPDTLPNHSGTITSVFGDGTCTNGSMNPSSNTSSSNSAFSSADVTILSGKTYGYRTQDNEYFWWQGGSGFYHWYQEFFTGDFYYRDGSGTRYLNYNAGGATKTELGRNPIRGGQIFSGTLYYADGKPTGLVYTDNNNVTQVLGTLDYSGDTTYFTGQLYTAQKVGELAGNKSLTDNGDGTYTLTIDSWATGEYQKISDGQPVIPEKTPLDIVLVVDQSGSMRTADLEGGNRTYTAVTENGADKTTWTLNELQSGTQYYYYDGAKYYPVQLGTGNLYEGPKTVRGNETFGWGNDGISVLVNGAPTYYNVRTNYYILADTNHDGLQEMHRVRAITAGLDLHYGFYPYIYNDESSSYAQMGKWTDNHYWFRLISPWGANKLRNNTRWDNIITSDAISFLDRNGNLLGSSDSACNSAKMNYSWITDTAYMKNLYRVNSRGLANIYYVNDNGEKILVGNRNFSKDDFQTNGALYTVSGGTERVAALESAVQKFVNAVKADATETGNTVDHKIAIVGYAQDGKDTAAAPVAGYVKGNANPYTNTGAFSGNTFGSFTNYDSNPAYALQSVSDVTFNTGTFGTWGGTYVAYGMDMANQILATDTAQRNTSKGTPTTPKKVVIVFTDGEPGASGYEEAVANSALATSSKLPSNVEVYTIGLYPQNASTEGLNFLKRLSSEYSIGLTPLQGTMNPDETYYMEDGGIYKSISTDYYGESSIGWWEYNTDTNTVRLMNVKGANAGAGEEYLYTDRNGGGETTGENADTSKRYYSADGYEAYYGYRWFDADMNMIDTTGLSVYTLSETRQSGGYSMTTSTKAGLESIFTELAASIQTQAGSSSGFTPGSTVTATNYDSTNSIIRDVISDDFALQNPTVTLQYVSASADTGGNITEGSAVAAPSSISYDLNEKTITVSGFDFGANSIYNRHNGNKLRVIITGLVPTNTGTVYSNVEARSGIYTNDYSEKLFSYNNPDDFIPTYTVQWSVDGSVVETDEGLVRGTFPSYDGAVPEKEDTATMTYTFVGWSAQSATDVAGAKSVDELPAVPENTVDNVVTYYAVFREAAVKTYTVHWMNGETELVTPAPTYLSGEHPSYDGDEPVNGDKIFVGWSTNANYEYDETTASENLYYGQKTVDQLAAGDSTVVYLHAIFVDKPGTLTVDSKTVVVEYNVKHEIAQGVYDFDVDVTKSSFGNFFKELSVGENPDGVGTLFFKVNSFNDFGSKDFGYDFTPMSSLNRATYYTGAPADSSRDRIVTTVTVVPGSSIYFDDSLEGATAQLVNGKYDYKTALAGLDEGAADAESLSKGESRVIKFNGTRIDVYCTTDNTTNSVYATLKMLDNEGNLIPAVDANKQTIKAKLVSNKFTNGGTMYSTPTVSFDNLNPENTYVLTLKSMSSMAYRLDGVRVYNATDNSMNGETNAKFVKVRDLLVEGFGSGTLDGETVTGAAFVDKDGFNTTSEFATYVDYGPKNEVYLAPGQGIAFQVNTAGYAVPTLMVGLKVKSGTGTAWISNGTGKTIVNLDSVVDQYFTVVPNAQGMVVIKNAVTTGNQLIAISNIKITGEAARMTTFAARPAALRSYVASFDALEEVPAVTEDPAPIESPNVEPTESPTVEPSADPDPDPTPTLQNFFMQLFSNFVNRLFGSIGRLFGGN